MKMNYAVSGEKRKALVNAISQELNQLVKYLGAPSFAYKIGDYQIDKNGLLTGPYNLDLEAVLNNVHNFQATARDYDEPDTYENSIKGMGALPSPDELTNDASVWAEREMKRMMVENENVPDYSNHGPNDGDSAPEIEDTLTIEIPLEGFTEDSLQNLERLIASKATLIKKALGVESLELERSETTLCFPWFKLPLQSDEISAYSSFISALCTASKLQKRVTAKDKVVDNEKFAFRVFLIKLGFVGDAYITDRKILLRNLSGNSAFKNGYPSSNEGVIIPESEADNE